MSNPKPTKTRDDSATSENVDSDEKSQGRNSTNLNDSPDTVETVDADADGGIVVQPRRTTKSSTMDFGVSSTTIATVQVVDSSVSSKPERSNILPPEEEEEEGVSVEVAPPSGSRSTADISTNMTDPENDTGVHELPEGDGGGGVEMDSLAAKKQAYAQKKAKKQQEEKDAELAHLAMQEEEEEEISLLDRHDSVLTPKQIVEKDILMYDLLLSNEELCDLPDEKKKKHPEGEEDGEEEEGWGEGMEDEGEDRGHYDEYGTDEEEEAEDQEGERQGEDEEEDQDGATDAGTDGVGGDADDPDNIVNMMMQAEDGDDDELKLLFRTDFVGEGAGDGADSLGSHAGIVGLNLSDETKKFLEVEKEVMDWREKWVWLSTKRVRLHIYIYEQKSEFAPYYDKIKAYPDFAMLLGLDSSQQTGAPFFLCLTPEARNYVMNPPKKRKVFVDLKKKEEEAWDKLASIVPRKWRSFGSDVEIDAEGIKNTRPLMTVYGYRYAEHFGAPTKFEDSNFPENSPSRFTGFDSKEPEKYPGVERSEVDKGVQVNPRKVEEESQTGFSFKRNKMVQYHVQEVSPEEAEAAMKSKECIHFFVRARHPVEKSLQQNEMLNVLADDYKNLKAVKGHEVEFNNESVLLQEYQTYTDQRHSKGRCVTHMAFHPLLDEVVMMSFTDDVTFDHRIELHSKTLMDPNFVLIWDLKDPSKPQLMLDAPSDVFSFMVSPSDPNLICGGCDNGQVVLWDCGKHYIELRNRIQDRKRKDSDGMTKPQSFLEKLKDSAEKYCCPLIPPAGLSNLDSSHKRVVTCVHWLPPHVELGKNGSLYENSWGGRSAQFFSVAGDSTCRVWDIRVQKLGLDEFDINPVSTIKVNPWHHLENNSWKYSSKYTLDDGSGTMFCTLMTLSEGKMGEGFITETGSRTGSFASSGASATVVGSETTRSSISTSQSQSRLKHAQSKSGGGKNKASQISIHGGSSSMTQQHSSAHSGDFAGRDKDHSNMATTMYSQSSMGETGDGSGGSGGGLNLKRGMVSSASNAQTSFFGTTDKGQAVLVDWLRNKDGSINPDAAGNKICQNVYIRAEMDGAITSVSRSPFHHELILVVGGGTIALWKENSAYPILATLGGENFVWCGCWSSTRPGVFFTGTREGSIQVWDLMEKSHAPVLTQQITPGRIVSVATPKSLSHKKHFLAAGDSQGNLFVLVIPRWYTKQKQGENQTIVDLMNREETRMAGWVADAENRQEKITKIHEYWIEKRATKTEKDIQENELKVESRLRMEYQDFLEFQAKLVGKLKRDEPQLPTDELDIDLELDALIQAAELQEAEKIKQRMLGHEEEDEESNEEIKK